MEKHLLALIKLREMIDGSMNGAQPDGGNGQLPPERDLAERLGVGRRSLRRALDVLEAEGRISRRQGQGTFLHPSYRTNAALLQQALDHTNPPEVMEVRLAVEPLIARLAAMRASRADIEELKLLAEETRLAASAEIYEAADVAFHRGIAAASRNSLFLSIYDSLTVLRRDAAWRQFGENGRCYKRQAAYAKFHQDIVEAIAARDGALAHEIMFDHLSDVQQNFLNRSLALEKNPQEVENVSLAS